jgi:uncharacterized membrane protein
MKSVHSSLKSKIIVLILLLAATVISLLLAVIRSRLGDTYSLRTASLNILLAWVPLVFAFLVNTGYIIIPKFRIVLWIFGIGWLLFFPNAPYILTDFQYLMTQTDNYLLSYDILMLAWMSWTGLLIGAASLYMMQEVVARKVGNRVGWIFAGLAMLLGSLGVMLGRFFRFYSWDVFSFPHPVARNIWGMISAPAPNLKALVFSLLFSLFFIFIYLSMHAFGRMFHANFPPGDNK